MNEQPAGCAKHVGGRRFRSVSVLEDSTNKSGYAGLIDERAIIRECKISSVNHGSSLPRLNNKRLNFDVTSALCVNSYSASTPAKLAY